MGDDIVELSTENDALKKKNKFLRSTMVGKI